jgi:hypothetical protein
MIMGKQVGGTTRYWITSIGGTVGCSGNLHNEEYEKSSYAFFYHADTWADITSKCFSIW